MKSVAKIKPIPVTERLLNSVIPAQPSEIIEVVEILSENFPSRAGDETGIEMRIKAFLMAVDDMPKDAVTAAATAFIKGKDARKNKTFLPTCAEFATETRLQFWRIEHEKRKGADNV